MKASDAVARLLSLNNVNVGFELIGGMITHLVDSINELGETTLLSLHHEQAAAFAAGGVARATNNKIIGLALGTSGPGATNLITGIADCWLDNYPCIFITGQVNTYELKGDKPLRQQGFQELDIVSLVESITKYAVQVKTAEEILPTLQKAINMAKEGRPGPVLIDIPMNLQREELNIQLNDINSFLNVDVDDELKSEAIDYSSLDCLLKNAEKPVFIIGGGACSEVHFDDWQSKISNYGIPCVSSLKGTEKTTCLPGYLGMLGAYGTRAANYAVQNADLIIILGSRLDVRQTGANADDFARSAKNIVQIDIDAAQLNNRVRNNLSIIGKCNDYFIHMLNGDLKINCVEWHNEVTGLFHEKFTDEYPELKFSPFQIVNSLSQCFRGKAVQFVADVGNHQMWLAHSLLLEKQQKSHHSGGLGAMGFSLPTAIGVKLATDDLVVSISGDGGFQLNVQELDIINREQLPILVIILNNHSLGMVKNFQDMYFEGRSQPTYWNGYSCSFKDIGEAYGIESHKVNDNFDFLSNVKSYVDNPRPLLIEVSIENITSCKPRLAFGKPIDEQYPND
ncbi:acetolactate synthase, large subunit [Aliivibrio fischeri ES114]|uniref:Acetolactate synthase, large subunit n=1 Tax=Aliivibrio fischeri (strain ATCC 700601 / ES114) TaxID=312309 RepID=Q5E8G6_ALIF1|nr:thiamine pyrophosphate-binding protein [Aliivibrio fischeri]AAW84680.1 acetolactate synthase, large subunit [Aliivibrio fischeri ES114]KLU78871.1 acetolactate synthase [Aliivibrio fischeri]